MEIWARVTLAFIAVYLLTCLYVVIEPPTETTTKATGPEPVFFDKLFSPPVDAVPNAVPGQAS
jgi:hypothetical protein